MLGMPECIITKANAIDLDNSGSIAGKLFTYPDVSEPCC
jgi:hypothetical protein